MKQRTKKKLAQTQVDKQWGRARRNLAQNLPNENTRKTLELLDLCWAHADLRPLEPYVSMGRLCLNRDPRYAMYYAFAFPCFYHYAKGYTVSDFDNYKKWHFATPEEAVDFAARHLLKVPLSAEFAVPLARATLQALTFDWQAATAVLELHSGDDTLLVCLTGVTGLTATQLMPSSVYSVLSLEYDNQQVYLWLHNGDHLRIAATGMEIRKR